jgi:hypothetical protein
MTPGRAKPDGVAMTYVLTNNFAGDVETYRRIAERVEPFAEGLVARYTGQNERGLAITTVWQSKAHADRFTAEHLMPAVHEFAGPAAGQPDGVHVDFETFDEFVAAR